MEVLQIKKGPELNVYYNNDPLCVGTKIVSKTYKIKEPKELLKQAEYAFIGTVESLKDSKIYDNGLIKHSMNVKVKEVIKGDVDQEVVVYRDGGSVYVEDYLAYEGDTVYDKGLLKMSMTDEMKRNKVIEVVPTSYFKTEEKTDYLFIVNHGEDGLEVLEDAYGMLKVKDNQTVINVYTNEEYKISDMMG